MFFVVWRGRGLWALLALFLPLLSCGLLDYNVGAFFFGAGFSLFAGGVICRHFGKKWNQGMGIHTLYWIPMEIWGWIYLVVGSFFVVCAVAGMIRKAVSG